MSLRIEFYADSIDDLRDQLMGTLRGLQTVPPPGYGISALGLNPAPDLTMQAHWETARQLGFRQGFERGLAEGKPGTYPRPEGMKDYVQSTMASNEVGPMPPGDITTQQALEESLAKQAEANRKTAVAVGQARQEYYAEREGTQQLGASVSSPEMVARSLAKQGRTLPGE